MLPSEANTTGRGPAKSSDLSSYGLIDGSSSLKSKSDRTMVPFFDKSTDSLCFPSGDNKHKLSKSQKSSESGKEPSGKNTKNKKPNPSKFSGREIGNEKTSCNMKTNSPGKRQTGKKTDVKELCGEKAGILQESNLNGSTSRGSQDDLFSDSLSCTSDVKLPKLDVFGHGSETDFRFSNRTCSSLSSENETQYSFANALIRSSNISEDLRSLSISAENKSATTTCDDRTKELKVLLRQMGILSSDDVDAKLKDCRFKEEVDRSAEKRYVFPKYMSSPDPSSIPVPGLP